jgi:hypothetical protein
LTVLFMSSSVLIVRRRSPHESCRMSFVCSEGMVWLYAKASLVALCVSPP